MEKRICPLINNVRERKVSLFLFIFTTGLSFAIFFILIIGVGKRWSEKEKKKTKFQLLSENLPQLLAICIVICRCVSFHFISTPKSIHKFYIMTNIEVNMLQGVSEKGCTFVFVIFLLHKWQLTFSNNPARACNRNPINF